MLGNRENGERATPCHLMTIPLSLTTHRLGVRRAADPLPDARSPRRWLLTEHMLIRPSFRVAARSTFARGAQVNVTPLNFRTPLELPSERAVSKLTAATVWLLSRKLRSIRR